MNPSYNLIPGAKPHPTKSQYAILEDGTTIFAVNAVQMPDVSGPTCDRQTLKEIIEAEKEAIGIQIGGNYALGGTMQEWDRLWAVYRGLRGSKECKQYNEELNKRLRGSAGLI
jgi:hypothetical protein